jgi:L-glutamine-phosphate cytidylyltransferase
MLDTLIILAAGMGTRLHPLTKDIPKGMVPLHGKPLLSWQIENARSVGIKKIVIVRGYQAEKIQFPKVNYVLNPDFNSTNMVASLRCAQDWFDEGFILAYGDILYNVEVLEKVMKFQGIIGVTVDMGWRNYWERRWEDPLEDAETLKFDSQGYLQEIGQKPRGYGDIEGQYIGLVAFSQQGVFQIRRWYENRYQDPNTYVTDMLQDMITQGVRIDPIKIERGWLEIDDLEDHDLAKKLSRPDSIGIRIIE